MRRGVVVEQVFHGNSCVVEGERWGDEMGSRPCDLILPGDVLLAVEAKVAARYSKFWWETTETATSAEADVHGKDQA